MLKVKNEGLRAEIYINGAICDDEDSGWVKFFDPSAQGYQFPQDVREQLEACRGKELTVYINSYGGSVAAGLAMASMIARHDAATTTVVDGVCCSIATQIFFSAKKCRMPSNSYLMIHAPSGWLEGTAAEMRAAADALDVIQEGLETTYRAKALETTTSEEIHAMMRGETWLTGADAAKVFNIELMPALAAVNCGFSREAIKSKTLPASVKFKDAATERIREAIERAKGVFL